VKVHEEKKSGKKLKPHSSEYRFFPSLKKLLSLLRTGNEASSVFSFHPRTQCTSTTDIERGRREKKILWEKDIRVLEARVRSDSSLG
jgi:hypothetical protein